MQTATAIQEAKPAAIQEVKSRGHNLLRIRRFQIPRQKYWYRVAECECGWSSKFRLSDSEAKTDWDNHFDAVYGAPRY